MSSSSYMSRFAVLPFVVVLCPGIYSISWTKQLTSSVADEEHNRGLTNGHGNAKEKELPRKATVSVEEVRLQPMGTSSGLKWGDGWIKVVTKATCEWMQT